MTLLKSRASWDDLVRAPVVAHVRGAVCMTCGRLVDEEGVVEGYPGESTRARYLVRHHGGEEARWFEMGSTNWEIADVVQMARRTNWFDPTAHEGLGIGREITPRDDIEDEEPRRIITTGIR